MKKRLVKLLTIACVTLMLSGMMTGCRDTSTPSSEATENTELTTEDHSKQENTEEILSENTEPTEPTEVSTETETSEQTATESTETKETSNMKTDFTTTLSDINAIQAGSAGSSLRSEAALSTFTTFVETYGADTSSETITQMTKEWLDQQKDDNAYIYDDLMENFDSMLCLTEDLDSTFTRSDAYKNVADGILNALQ